MGHCMWYCCMKPSRLGTWGRVLGGGEQGKGAHDRLFVAGHRVGHKQRLQKGTAQICCRHAKSRICLTGNRHLARRTAATLVNTLPPSHTPPPPPHVLACLTTYLPTCLSRSRSHPTIPSVTPHRATTLPTSTPTTPYYTAPPWRTLDSGRLVNPSLPQPSPTIPRTRPIPNNPTAPPPPHTQHTHTPFPSCCLTAS